MGFLLTLFLVGNLVASQLLPSPYFRLIKYNRDSAVEVLKKIKSTPEFNKELAKTQRIFGKEIVSEVFKEEEEKKQIINNLNYLLTKNPKARDVLYDLYLLYNSQKSNKAQDYLKRAKEIDPLMGGD